jgi:transcriptional regulator
MYISAVDSTFGEEEWRPFVERQGFGHLVAAGRHRDVPVVVPTQFVLDADVVLLHLVAANPIFDALAEQPRVLLSVAGDWAFIPSGWKAIGCEDPRLGIPTTYYGAVQLVGSARVESEPAAVAEVLRRQLAVFQPDVDVADPADVHGPKLSAIRGITITIDEVRAKFKYGGNVDDAHRQAVIERLRERSGQGDVAAAAHAERRGHPPS